MIVVSDTSPLIALGAIGELEIIRHLYGEVLVPELVYREIVEARADAPGASAVATAPWIRVQALAGEELYRSLIGALDPGEAQAIALAVEIGADLILIDERVARRAALDHGIKVVGVAGVLLEAKTRGIVPLVKPLLDAVIAAVAFRISRPLYERILDAAGETV